MAGLTLKGENVISNSTSERAAPTTYKQKSEGGSRENLIQIHSMQFAVPQCEPTQSTVVADALCQDCIFKGLRESYYDLV